MPFLTIFAHSGKNPEFLQKNPHFAHINVSELESMTYNKSK